MAEKGRFRWWTRGHRESSADRDPGRVLVKECEDFLAGRLADEWARDHWRVPAWAWMNLLTHSSASRLAAVRDGELGTKHLGSRAWMPALSFLAGVALAAADAAACDLEAIQHDVFVPLELELQTSKVYGPDELVGLVVGALKQYRT